MHACQWLGTPFRSHWPSHWFGLPSWPACGGLQVPYYYDLMNNIWVGLWFGISYTAILLVVIDYTTTSADVDQREALTWVRHCTAVNSTHMRKTGPRCHNVLHSAIPCLNTSETRCLGCGSTMVFELFHPCACMVGALPLG